MSGVNIIFMICHTILIIINTKYNTPFWHPSVYLLNHKHKSYSLPTFNPPARTKGPSLPSLFDNHIQELRIELRRTSLSGGPSPTVGGPFSVGGLFTMLLQAKLTGLKNLTAGQVLDSFWNKGGIWCVLYFLWNNCNGINVGLWDSIVFILHREACMKILDNQ